MDQTTLSYKNGTTGEFRGGTGVKEGPARPGPAGMRMRRFHKARRWIGHRTVGLVVVGVFLMASYFDAPQRIEDFAFHTTGSLAGSAVSSSRVAVLAVDAQSLDKLGPWPWSRQVLADGIASLKSLKVRTIGVMVPLGEPQSPARLDEMNEEALTYKGRLRKTLGKWVWRLDTDRTLSRAIDEAGNVILAAEVREVGGGLRLERPEAGAPLKQHILGLPDTLRSLVFAPPVSSEYESRPPLARFSRVAAAVGPLSPAGPEGDRAGVLLALQADDRMQPTFVARLMTRSIYARGAKIRPRAGEGVQLGRKLLVTAPDFRYYPPPAGAGSAEAELHVHSFSDLWNQDAHLQDLAGATVLIGPTVAGLVPAFGARSPDAIPPVIKAARALASFKEGIGYTRAPWFYGVQRAFILSLVLLLALPVRFHGRRLLVISAAGALLLLNVGLVGLVARHMWMPVGMPALGLVCLTAASYVQRLVDAAIGRVEQQSGELRLRFAANLHAQNNLDSAFDEYRLCPPSKAMMERLYQLGLDYERRRQLDRAAQVYDHLRGIDSRYRDVRNRRARLHALATQYPGLSPAGSANDTVLMDDTKLEKPTLAHYQLDKQIGRGAMARVYLATDQKLGRQVALKVLSMPDDFRGGDLEALERRFRREAEAEAQMSHPNIVTVYETGKDRDLVYIAMEYLQCTTLEEFTDPDNLLSADEIVEVGIQTAQALDYAHGKGIIHRDVKPSNILYLRESRFVKVSDFGIARISDQELTSTGSILGTPSYMSPEQAVGEEIDGRSDLFSLGTTLYQLIAGKLPFTADSVPGIMFQITKEKHASLSTVRPDVDESLCKVIDKALQKNPSRRFQAGQEMSEALEACRESMSEQRPAKKTRSRSKKSPRRRSSAA